MGADPGEDYFRSREKETSEAPKKGRGQKVIAVNSFHASTGASSGAGTPPACNPCNSSNYRNKTTFSEVI